MRPIYSFTLKDLISSKDNSENQNYKFIVIKEHNYKLKKIIKNQNITIEEVDGLNYEQSTKDFLFFKIETSNSKDFQKYLKTKLADFLIENNGIEKESTKSFLKYLEDDSTYGFDAVTPIENEDKLLIEAILNSPSSTPTLLRPNSVRYESVSEKTPLRKIPSFHDLPKENSPKISRPAISPDQFCSQHSIHSQDSLETSARAYLIEGAQKIHSFFTEKEHNNNLANIERHGLNIKGSYFNGNGKSKILLNITELAAQIRNSTNEIGSESSSEQILGLKQNISKLNVIINDKQNLETLSRYRGFSAFKCFATLWGGGKVKSIEYVEQLREQVGSLSKDLTALRPTV
ncbi:hypothetical protein [Rickettsiella endosymbiont of Miltochrista miniata]|uniref:hypothetical protein n=1 Tax=Rickettsiella endosymbiont of Miltochrista miniata TaxID=3066239 RepID=UPI00313DE71A